MNLHNPFALAGIPFLLAAVFWFFLSKSRKSNKTKTASGQLDAAQVIYLLSLLALLVLAVLTWNDRAISMPLLGLQRKKRLNSERLAIKARQSAAAAR